MAEPTGVCDVCLLVDGDRRADKPISWCERCQAWICDACRRDWIRRGEAWIKRKAEPKAERKAEP